MKSRKLCIPTLDGQAREKCCSIQLLPSLQWLPSLLQLLYWDVYIYIFVTTSASSWIIFHFLRRHFIDSPRLFSDAGKYVYIPIYIKTFSFFVACCTGTNNKIYIIYRILFNRSMFRFNAKCTTKTYTCACLRWQNANTAMTTSIYETQCINTQQLDKIDGKELTILCLYASYAHSAQT